jgi:hypothetical protein
MKLIKACAILALLLLFWHASVQTALSQVHPLDFPGFETLHLSLNGLYSSQVVWIPFQSSWVLEKVARQQNRVLELTWLAACRRSPLPQKPNEVNYRHKH